ncbi:MAG: glycosyltransferase family 39 protein [Planctomycetota bacterium]
MRSFGPPLAAALLVLGVRALVAASRLDELELERYGGTVAFALRHGIALDPAQLPIIEHLRGSYVFALLLVPLTFVFGSNLWVLKLLAVLWSALGAALVAVIARRHVGALGTAVAVGLVAFAPPALQMVDVLALGSHADTVPFLLLPTLLLLDAPSDRPMSWRRAAALGASVGAAIFFSYQALVALPAWALLLVLRQHPGRNWLRTIPVACLAALPALLCIPLLTHDATTIVNRPIGERVLASDFGQKLGKFASAATYELRRSWLFEEQGVGLVGWVLLAAIVASVAFVLVPRLRSLRTLRTDGRAQVVLVAVVHTACLLGAYAVTDLAVNLTATLDGTGSRYFVPLWPGFALAIGAGCQALRTRVGAAAGWGTGAVLVALAALGTLPMLDPMLPTRQPRVAAHELYSFRDHLAYAAPGLSERVALVRANDHDWVDFQPIAYFDASSRIEVARPDFAARLEEARRGDGATVPFVCVAAGSTLAEEATRATVPPQNYLRGLVLAARDEVAATDAAERRWFMRGVGRTLGHRAVEYEGYARRDAKRFPRARVADLFRALEWFGADAPAVAEGLGFFVGLRATPYDRIQTDTLRSTTALSPTLVEPLYRGFGWGYRVRFREDGYFVPTGTAIEELLPEHGRSAFREGLAWQGGPP